MTMCPPIILITCDVQEAEGQPTETLLRLRFKYLRVPTAFSDFLTRTRH